VNFAQQPSGGCADLTPKKRDNIKWRFPLVRAAWAIQWEMNVRRRIGTRHFLTDCGTKIFSQAIAAIQQAAFKKLLGAVDTEQIGAGR
jgi:hypothetical protein